MRIFVISWFFPPLNSSEGMVTFKLLKSSRHEYVVFSSNQLFWSYDNRSLVASLSDSKNIRAIYSSCKNLEDWQNDCFNTFIALHREEKFDAIMSRTMPPETIGVAKQIKNQFPTLPWIASLGDPLSNNPYLLFESSKYKSPIEKIKGLRRKILNKKKQSLRKLKELELTCLSSADVVIFPNKDLRDFVGQTAQIPTWIIPHSFDKSLFPSHENIYKKGGKIKVTYVGVLDSLRNPDFLFDALRNAFSVDRSLSKKLEVSLYGNFDKELKRLIKSFGLEQIVLSHPPVSYEESLKIMQESDWLLHIDANFKSLEETGGSVFFAGKIADYFGTNKPIIGLTGQKSTAGRLIHKAGGQVFSNNELDKFTDFILNIENHTCRQQITRTFREQFNSCNVAKSFDEKVDQLVLLTTQRNQPLVTFCVPCYNSACYIDSCLESILKIKDKSSFELILVNDGSQDITLSLLEKWKSKYSSIISLIDKPNGGHGSVINAALKQARGVYFKVVDSDDTVIPDALDSLFTFLITTGQRPDLISSNYIQFFSETNEEVQWAKKNPKIPYSEEILFNQFDLSNEFFTLAGSFFKTKLLKRMVPKISEKVFYDDMEYVLFPIPFVRTLLFYPQDSYRYLIGRPGQSVSTDAFLKNFKDHKHVVLKLLSWYQGQKPLLEEAHSRYIASVLTNRLIPTHTWLCSKLVERSPRLNSDDLSFNKYLFKNHPDIFWKSFFKSNTIVASRVLGMHFFKSSLYVFLKKLREKVSDPQ